MAIFLSAKAPSDVYRYTWSPSLADGDTIASFALSASGVTVDSQAFDPDGVIILLSGGTAGQTATITASADTVEGETLTETLYLPIIASTAQIADSARSYINFALRRIIGVGETPSADELDDALERLSAMITEWRESGADIGAPFPLTADTIIYCPDYAASALRYNLLVDCASVYGQPVTQMEMMRAMRGLQLVKNRNLPEDRPDVYY